MALTSAEKQKRYRERKSNGNAPKEVTRVTEPLCNLCGRPTGHPLVVRCGPCCWGNLGKENK